MLVCGDVVLGAFWCILAKSEFRCFLTFRAQLQFELIIKNMATTIRPGSSGREKRGTSLSAPLIKKTPKPSSQTLASSSSSRTNGKNPSPADKKTVASHLKPAIRSSTDSSQKPVVDRRRSFDRPPPASQVNRAIRNSPETREVKHIRSSSFSHKPSTSSPLSASTRPASTRTYARTTLSLKEGSQGTTTESGLSKSRVLKRNATLSPSIARTTKKDIKYGLTSSVSTKKGPKSVTSESGIEHVYDDIPSIDQLGDDIEVQSLPEISEMPDLDEELGDPTIIDIDIKAKLVVDLQDNVAISVYVDEGKSSVDVDKKRTEKEEQTVEKHPETQNVEELVEEQNVTVEEQSQTAESDEGDKEGQNVEQTVIEVVDEKKEELEVKEEKPSDSSPTAETPEPAKVQTVAGKKEKQDYNNVIEETATKLMGGRKNKVLALAGAFETVISLQDTNKN